MNKKFLLAAASVAMLATPAMAYADDDEPGIYVRGNLGYGMHSDADFTDDFVGDVESEGGATGSLGLGYDFGEHWRLEADYASLFTDLGQIGQVESSFAKLNTDTAMVNAIYDFDFDAFDNFKPYVGAGIGLVRGQLSAQAHSFTDPTGVGFINTPVCAGTDFACGIKDSDSSLGWQLLAGLGYEISDNLTWDTHYRYLNAGDMEFEGHKNFGGVSNTTLDVAAHSLMTGFRYKFGAPTPKVMYTCWNGNKVEDLSTCAARPTPPPAPVMQTCWDGSQVSDLSQCAAQPAPEPVPAPQTYSCWDGSLVYDLATCPAQPAPVQQTFLCSDGVTTVTDMGQCPVMRSAAYNNCGASNVAIFDVPVNTTPKQMPRLGTMPEFGDSHGLSSSQFFDKLSARYSSNATDRAYLNYLFKSMGYPGGFKDANASMISEDVLEVGTAGLLGLGKQHHYKYSVLPSTDRDRQAFRIASANGTVIHFMKTCGNYFYACN